MLTAVRIKDYRLAHQLLGDDMVAAPIIKVAKDLRGTTTRILSKAWNENIQVSEGVHTFSGS